MDRWENIACHCQAWSTITLIYLAFCFLLTLQEKYSHLKMSWLCVRIKEYSQDQRELLHEFDESLIANGMAYTNSTSSWACTSLLAPMRGVSRFRFTGKLRPVNHYRIKHQYSLPIFKEELTKLAGSKLYVTSDLSYSYLNLSLDVYSRICQSPWRLMAYTLSYAYCTVPESLSFIYRQDLKAKSSLIFDTMCCIGWMTSYFMSRPLTAYWRASVNYLIVFLSLASSFAISKTSYSLDRLDVMGVLCPKTACASTQSD